MDNSDYFRSEPREIKTTVPWWDEFNLPGTPPWNQAQEAQPPSKMKTQLKISDVALRDHHYYCQHYDQYRGNTQDTLCLDSGVVKIPPLTPPSIPPPSVKGDPSCCSSRGLAVWPLTPERSAGVKNACCYCVNSHCRRFLQCSHSLICWGRIFFKTWNLCFMRQKRGFLPCSFNFPPSATFRP